MADKKIKLDCFTDNVRAYNSAAPVKPYKTYPKWWVDLPNLGAEGYASYNPKNMKTCYGFVELFKRGILLRNWCNLHLTVTEQGVDGKVDNGEIPSIHRRFEYQGAWDNHHHIKLSNPWFLKEDTGVQFLFIAAEWFLIDYDFVILPGMLEFSVNRVTHINMILPIKSQDYSITLPFGLPLVQMIPMTDTAHFEFDCHLIKPAEMIEMAAKTNHAKNFRELIHDKKTQNQCPFH